MFMRCAFRRDAAVKMFSALQLPFMRFVMKKSSFYTTFVTLTSWTTRPCTPKVGEI